jgi:hypothetical protein
MIHRSGSAYTDTQRQQRRQLNRIFLFWRSISPLDNRCPKSASLTSCAALPTYGLRDLRLLAVNETITVDCPLLYSPHARRHWHGLPGSGRQMRSILSKQVSAFFSGIPLRADRPFFSGSFLLSLAVPPSRAADNTDGEHSGPP